MLSFDPGATPNHGDNGLTWNPSVQADGAADVLMDLGGTAPQAVSQFRVYSMFGTGGARHFELWTSSTTTAPGDFALAFTGELPNTGEAYTFDFPAVSARFVRIRVLERWDGVAGAGRIDRATLWTRERDGGAISLLEAGVTAVASAGSNPEYAIDFNPQTQWNTFGAGVPINGQTLTVDLPGTAYHLVDRVRLWGGDGTTQLRNFEVLVSSTTDDPAEFSVVAAELLPNPSSESDYFFFFPPTRARFVQLRSVDNHGGTGYFRLGGFTVFTPHEGGLTVPFEDRSAQGGEPHEQHPTHTFPAPGTYVVRLQVIDGYGLHSTDEFAYSAYGPPVADFIVNSLPATQGDNLQIVDTSYPDSAPLIEAGITPRGEVARTSDDGVRTSLSPGGSRYYPMQHGGPLQVTGRGWSAHRRRPDRRALHPDRLEHMVVRSGPRHPGAAPDHARLTSRAGWRQCLRLGRVRRLRLSGAPSSHRSRRGLHAHCDDARRWARQRLRRPLG